jgi:hypothetical protein
MPGLNEPPRHVRAHIAETDKADVHDVPLSYSHPEVAAKRPSKDAIKI